MPGMKEQAILSFERAVGCGDQEGIATRDLARLCRCCVWLSTILGVFCTYLSMYQSTYLKMNYFLFGIKCARKDIAVFTLKGFQQLFVAH